MENEVKWYLIGEVHYLSRAGADQIIRDLPLKDNLGVRRGQLKYDKRDGTYSVFKLTDRPVQPGQQPWNGKATRL